MEVLRKINIRNSFTDFVSLFFAIAVIFGIAIFFLILYNAYNDNIKDNLSDALTGSTPQDANSNVTKILDSTGSGIALFDTLFPLLLVGIFGFVLVSALFARSHPAFLFIGLLVLGVALILGAVYSNVYEAISEDVNFNDSSNEFNITGLFLGNLPIIVLLLFIAISIILYVIFNRTPGGGQI